MIVHVSADRIASLNGLGSSHVKRRLTDIGHSGRDTNFHARVPFLSQLALEELVQLGVEDTIGDELPTLRDGGARLCSHIGGVKIGVTRTQRIVLSSVVRMAGRDSGWVRGEVVVNVGGLARYLIQASVAAYR